MNQPGREALAMLAKLPDPPTRIEEQVLPPPLTEPGPRDPRVVHLDFQRDEVLLTADDNDLRLAVLAGAGVPSCVPPSHGSLPDQAARAIAAAYFTGKLELLPEYTRNWFKRQFGAIEQVWNEFRALPPDVQAARIVAVRQTLLTCRGEPIDALVPGALR
ncbi:hypothetical protein [Amycolatopsis solani]|uniref:hypothetical protein n=1 Tax=Amycolatopsis solani TaxID=3028615 RepID=UPI0025B14190|nr:hypothetical protein [Amycolatopsis sp. MEP2-6]